MRLEDKIAVIVGAGQSPGEGIANGRATTLRFAQEGARILAVDRLMAAAEETASMVVQAGGECVPFAADVTKEETLAAPVGAARARWGRIDILHNNVGVSIAGGDKPLEELTEEAFDRVCAINLRGTIMACKHVLPIMRRQRAGAIVNISSVAARENSYPLAAYKATKAAMIAFTEQLALQNASYGIRANCILPGLMDTPMAVGSTDPHQCAPVDRQCDTGNKIWPRRRRETAPHSRHPMPSPCGYAAEPWRRAPRRLRRGCGCWRERACRLPAPPDKAAHVRSLDRRAQLGQHLKALGASGQLGYGIPEPSLARGIECAPDYIGADMGCLPTALTARDPATERAAERRRRRDRRCHPMRRPDP